MPCCCHAKAAWFQATRPISRARHDEKPAVPYHARCARAVAPPQTAYPPATTSLSWEGPSLIVFPAVALLRAGPSPFDKDHATFSAWQNHPMWGIDTTYGNPDVMHTSPTSGNGDSPTAL